MKTKGGTFPPFFIIFVFVISLILGGTTQAPIFLIRLSVLVYCLIVLRNGISIPRQLTFPLFLFFLYSLFALFKSSTASSVWPSIQWSLNIIICFLFFIILLQEVESERLSAEQFINGILFLLPVEFVIQMYQKIVLGTARPSGSFFNPNFLGEFYSMNAILILALILFRKGNETRLRILCSGALLVSLAGIVLTASRGAILAFIAGTTLLLMLRYRLKGVALVFLILGFLMVYPNPVKTRLFHSVDIYRYSRLNIYEAAFSVFIDNPSGIGLGNFKFYFSEYAFPIYQAVAIFGKKAKTVHNEHLQVLIELGIPGIALYIGFMATLILNLLGKRGRGSQGWVRSGAFCGLISLVVHAAADSVYHTFALPVTALLFIGLILSTNRCEWKKIRFGRFLNVSVAMICIFLIVISLGTASGYYVSRYGEKLVKRERFDRGARFAGYSTVLDPLSANNMEKASAAHFRAYVRSGNEDSYMKSLAYMNRAIELQKKNDRLHERKAFLLIQGIDRGAIELEETKKVMGEVVNSYLNSLNLNPYNVITMKNLSLLFLRLQKIDDAERLLKKAVSTEPNFAMGHYLLGKIRDMKGEEAEAGFLYKKAYSVYKKYLGVKGLGDYAEILVRLDDRALNEVTGGAQ